ncbi:MAG: hypothetical protein JXA25_16750 [Anaerolineales bacterium]|nr:hypothetical protein [Anaerolineales bacterium]
MTTQTQAAVEEKLGVCLKQIEEGSITEEQAFGNQEDWTINLGSRPAVLHPGFKQWLWYDRLHDEWVFAGCGVGEAVLLTFGDLGGIKKLPEPDVIDGWCVYRQEQDLHGPLRIEELLKHLDSQEVPQDIQIWSTRASGWLTVDDEKVQDIFFANDSP